MTITVAVAPSTESTTNPIDPATDAAVASQYDMMANRRRAIAYAKNADDPQAFQANFDAALTDVETMRDNFEALKQALVDAANGTVGTADQPTAGDTYDFPDEDAKLAAIAEARKALRGDQLAIDANTAWYGNGGVPVVADVSGAEGYTNYA